MSLFLRSQQVFLPVSHSVPSASKWCLDKEARVSGLSNCTLCMVQVVLEGSVDDPRSSRSLTSKLAVNTVDLYRFVTLSKSIKITGISIPISLCERSFFNAVKFEQLKGWLTYGRAGRTQAITFNKSNWNLELDGIPYIWDTRSLDIHPFWSNKMGSSNPFNHIHNWSKERMVGVRPR